MKLFFKKLLCTVLSLFFVFLALPYYSADIYAVEFSGVDLFNSNTYSVKQDDFTVSITYNYINTQLSVDDRILCTSCYDKKITMLCATQDFLYSVHTFDTSSGHLNYYLTELDADLNTPVFACDKYGNVCILNSSDKRIVDVIQNNKSTSVKFSSAVYQIIYTCGEDFLIITADGVYSLIGDNAKHISDLVPATPCKHSSDGFITDALGKQYTYISNEFRLYEAETASAPSEPSESFAIFDDCIYILQGTTFAKLYKELGIDKSQLTITKSDGSNITTGKLGTGMTAEFSGKTYTVVIPGDLTGEGNLNSRDLKALMKHLSGEVLLKGAFYKAADTYNDSQINTKDLLKLASMQ